MTTSRCSTSARRRGDSLVGTAAPATRWLLIEHPGGWAPAALDSPGIDPVMADRLHRAALTLGGRVLLIRRPASRGAAGRQEARPGAQRGPRQEAQRGAPHVAWRQWGVVDVDGTQQWGTWGESRDLSSALATLLAGPDERALAPPATPLLLVCTHGRHDVCCAVRGRPVAQALADRWPEQTWECTHIGGDRFAANVLVVPDGTVYGGLDDASALDVVARHLQGLVDTDHLRGFSAHSPPVQAALAAVLRVHGPAAVTDVRPGDVFPSEKGDRWEVLVLGSGIVPSRTEVTVRRTRQPAARLTCRAESDSSAFAWTTTLGDAVV